MNSGPILFLCAFLTMAASFWGLILKPYAQLATEDLRQVGVSKRLYPNNTLGLAKAGADVYRAHGCVECHTQQVRPEGQGGDIARGWGIRRTVAQDYLLEQPVQLGSLRVGPDLANVGARLPDAQWHYQHMYAPRSKVPESTMPAYKFLFRKQPITGAGSPDALQFEDDFAPEEGFEIVPTEAARALVAYLTSRRADLALFEAPVPASPDAEGDTNAAPAQAESITTPAAE